MNSKIPVILCVDAEPDPRLIERKKCEPWGGYEAMHDFLREMRPRLEEATGSPVHYSWFYRVDPQIADGYEIADWAFQYYREQIQFCQAQGDEIGLHPHAYRWDGKGWLADHGNQEWIEYCLNLAFESFQKNFGSSCRSFRFGDRWMNQETMDYLTKAGVRYDLTLEPGYTAQKKMNLKNKKERATGFLPDTKRMPQFPYRPKRNNYLAPEASVQEGLWILPVSTALLEPRMGRRERLQRTLFQPATLQPFPWTCNLAFNAEGSARVLDSLLNKEKIPFLNLVVRTDAAVREDYRRNLEANFKILMAHPLRKQFVFSTPEETIDLLGYEGVRAGRKPAYELV